MAKAIQLLSILALLMYSQSALGLPKSRVLGAVAESLIRVGPARRTSPGFEETTKQGNIVQDSKIASAAVAGHRQMQRKEIKQRKSNSNGGLVFDVIHRQHPDSPFRQVDKSHADFIQESLRRGMLREESLNRIIASERAAAGSTKVATTRESVVALLPGSSSPGEYWPGEYLVQMQMGTPPKPILLIIDTGSGLTWTQCNSCVHCFNQQQPIFDPSFSSSYKVINCPSAVCSSSSSFQCAVTSNYTCEYGIAYSGQSGFTTGVVSQDILTVNSVDDSGVHLEDAAAPVIIEDFLFGCGLNNMGNGFVGSSGLLGLSRSNISFPTQLAARLNYPKKFTHCFADLVDHRNATSFISFGSSVHQSLQYTPFAKTPFRTQFYYIEVSGISVDGHLLPINSSVFNFDQNGNGGTIIDSGTTLTLLVDQAYKLFRDAFRSAARKLPDVLDGGFNSSSAGHVMDTCYQFHDNERPKASAVPSVTLHFSNDDAFKLTLPTNNVLFPFNDDGLYCLAFASTLVDEGVNVLGNIQQQNFLIEYDLDNSRIGFGRSYCGSENR